MQTNLMQIKYGEMNIALIVLNLQNCTTKKKSEIAKFSSLVFAINWSIHIIQTQALGRKVRSL